MSELRPEEKYRRNKKLNKFHDEFVYAVGDIFGILVSTDEYKELPLGLYTFSCRIERMNKKKFSLSNTFRVLSDE